jgi:class 3 adenylate cyclase
MNSLETALAQLQGPIRLLGFQGPLEGEFCDDFIRKSLQPMRFALALALFLYAAFGVLDVWVVPEVAHVIWAIRYAIVVPVLATVLAYSFHPTFHRSMQRLLPAIVLVLGFGILAMIAIAGELGRAYYYAGLILVIVWNYTIARLTFGRATVVGWGLVLSYEVVATIVSPVPAVVLVNNNFFFVSANIIGMVACYYAQRELRLEFVQRRIVDLERQRSDSLLLNVLPARIADRLKQRGGTLADTFDDVTVCFCDIVEFTPLCSRLTALETVTLLNELFTALDALAAKHGLEKIKTIGDSYMIVGGVPTPRPDHAEAIADFALDVQRTVAGFTRYDGAPLQVRIGIHTGAVVAGVIGSTKYTYDVWGDAVITASRMERHGVPGAIQVSEATYERLESRYVFAPRGAVNVKGKGPLLCWMLLRRVESHTGPELAAASTPALHGSQGAVEDRAAGIERQWPLQPRS